LRSTAATSTRRPCTPSAVVSAVEVIAELRESGATGGRAIGASDPWLVVVIVCVAQFMVVLDATIVNVTLPTIQRGLRFSPSSLQWVINMCTLIFGGFMLLGGRAGDLIGRRRVFGAGIVLFAGASLLNGLALASGLLNTAQQVGGLIGLAILSTLAASRTTNLLHGPVTPGSVPAARVSGFHVAFIAAVVLLGAAWTVAALQLSTHRVREAKPRGRASGPRCASGGMRAVRTRGGHEHERTPDHHIRR
jgi:MFS family permease